MVTSSRIVRWRYIAILILLPMALSAEIRPSVKLDLRNNLAINPDPDDTEVRYLVGGTGRLAFDSTGNRNVKAHLSILANIDTVNQNILLDRAYIITRFDILRLTFGKTRLSWGEGAAFNAADLVMGATDLNVNLTTEEFRSQSLWMSALNLSLDRFAFVEAVLLPPLPNPRTDSISFGGRILTQFDEIALKLEGGYFYRGNEKLHQTYFSLHGGDGLNWHLSAALSMDEESVTGTAEDFFKGLQISGGLNFLTKIRFEDTGEELGLGLRAQLLFDNGGEFSEQKPVSAVLPTYGLYGYLDASMNIDQFSIYARSIISPIDVSAILIAGASFAIYQGFTLYGNVSVQFGDDDDIFRYNRLGGYGMTVGVRFIF